MANAVEGLGTVNVSSLVSQLMQVESQPRNILARQRDSVNQTQTAWQSLNTNLASLRTAAEKMVGVKTLLSTPAWSVSSVTSSSTGVAGTASSGALNGSYAIDVTQLAATHRLLFGSAVPSTTTAATGSSIDITQNGTTTTLALTDTTLAGVAAAINAKTDLGVRAALINTGAGYRLQLSSSSSGATGAFTVSGLTPDIGTPTITATGADAQIRFGPGVADVASSKTNTFTDVLPGVTFTVSKLETGVTLNVADDATAMGNQIKAIVDGVNAARTLIGTQTSYDAKARKGAALTGESLPRELSAKLSAVITNGVSGQSLSKIGIQVDRSGTLTFDQTKFAAALASPTVDTRGLATAFAKSVRDIAADASDATKGTIATQIASGTSTLKRMDAALTSWDDRLSARQTALTRQYAALNVQLQNLQSQQSSLAGAIAQLG